MGGQTDYNYTYDDLYQLVTTNWLHKGSNQENRYGLEMKYNSVHGIVKKEQTQDFRNGGGDWTSKKIVTNSLPLKSLSYNAIV